MQELTNIEKLERNKRVAKKIGRGTLHALRFIAGAAGSVSISYGNNQSDDDWDYEKKPVITHDKTRWDYDPWLENR